MADITDMGLPAGLPEMLRAACPRWKADDGKTYEYNPLLHSYREVDEHREMTAADLGLRCSCDRTDCAQCSETWRRSFVSPYSFWLGADHG